MDVSVMVGMFDANTFKKITESHPFEHCIISSVRTVDDNSIKEISKSDSVVWVNSATAIPIKIKYRTPETLGIDRICLAVGAAQMFPNQHCLVIDAGTCITYDLVNENHEYLGGTITPGITMRLRAMNHFTHKLPLIEPSGEWIDIGMDTKTCMQMGSEVAAALEMKALIDHYSRQFANLKVILTGGDAPYFEQHVENAIFAAPNILGHGLNAILLWNKQQE